MINEPTRITENFETRIDHVIINKKDNVKVFGVYPLSISDHNFVYIIRKIGFPRGNPKVIKSRNFKTFDQTAFLLDLQNTNWPSATEAAVVNDFWSKWKDTFLNIKNKHPSSRTIKVLNKSSPWINPEIKHNFYNACSRSVKKITTKTKNLADWNNYKRQKKLCQ